MKFYYINTSEPIVSSFEPHNFAFKNSILEITNEYSRTHKYEIKLIGKFGFNETKLDHSFHFIFHIDQNTEELEKLLQMLIMFKLEFSDSNIQQNRDYIKQIIDIITLYNEIDK